ncbi:MAG: ThuA domain-containing protein [Verrucomicrobiales bacterium]
MYDSRCYLAPVVVALALGVGRPTAGQEKGEDAAPIRALLVTGGCCHDYENQKAILSLGIRERIHRKVEWVIPHQGQGKSDEKIPLFEDPDWAADYDIVVHNYCFPRVRDPDYVERILAPHREGLPAVLIHGTMHSFRTGDDRWFEFCGVSSPDHGPHHPFAVEPVDPDNPILGARDHFTTPNGELYFVEKVWPNATPIAESVSEETGEKHVTVWTHRYGSEKARVFGTTVGNHTETMIAPEYLDMVARGFLWALDELSEENFKGKDPAESLKSITLEPPKPDLPRPGRNLASEGDATALSEAESGDSPPSAAVDGDIATFWQASRPGPSSWEVSIEEPKPTGSVALVWKDDSPPDYSVEGSSDGLDWERLVAVSDPESSRQVSVHETAGEFSRFRVTVERTKPEAVVGLREFAVYRDAEDVPAAIRLAGFEDDNADQAAEEVPETVETSETMNLLSEIRLPAGFRVRQLVPTASGNLFILLSAEDKSSSRVLSVSPVAGDERRVADFLLDLDPETAIGWDGEWVYTLEETKLTAFRDTDRNGMADERFRMDPVLSLADDAQKTRLRFSQMSLGLDGRFVARLESSFDTTGFNQRGETVDIPKHGIVTFGRRGEDLEIISRSTKKITSFRTGHEGVRYIQTARQSREFFVSEVRELLAFTGVVVEKLHPLPETSDKKGRLLGVASGGDVWVGTEDEIARYPVEDGSASEDGGMRMIAGMPSVSLIEPDGLGRVWVCFDGDSAEGARLALFDTGESSVEPVDFDRVRDGSLTDFLSSPSPLIRLEAQFETLRRRRFPQEALTAILAHAREPEAQTAALFALDEARGQEFFPTLTQLARSSDSPEVRAWAFRAIGRSEGAANHSVFGAITEEKVPRVTAEILAAILRTDTDVPGLEALALEFAANENPTLSTAAKAFLIEREAVEACFAALDDHEQSGLWRTAFDVLSAMERQTVVEGIGLRLEQTRSPEMRQLGLETLMEMYYSDEAGKTTWAGTRIADLMLRASLADHRVDRAFLLDEMMTRRIPISDTLLLVELGSRHLWLEAAVIELLLNRDVPYYARKWLMEVARSESRDGDLRLRAVGLLASLKSPPVLREIFPILSSRDLPGALPDTERLTVNRWLENPAQVANSDWLIRQAQKDDPQRAWLAWRTLLSLVEDPALEAAAAERIETAMNSAVAREESQAMPLLRALEGSTFSGARSLLAKASENENLRVKKASIALSEDASVQEREDPLPKDRKLETLATDSLIETLGGMPGDEAEGEEIFARLSCGECHNIHGEGLAIGPDLATAVRELSGSGLAEAILHPDETIAPGFESRAFELEGGLRLKGHLEGTDRESVTLRDTAGNRTEVPRVRIERDEPVAESIMPDEPANALTVGEFASLLRYVRSLGEF